MKVLFDTSALYKRYSDEFGTQQVDAVLQQASEVLLAAHCKTEIASALCRDQFNAGMTREEYFETFALVQSDFDDFTVVGLNARVEALAIAAMQGNRLRAVDALHIGTAQVAGVDLFVTADRKQAAAAQASGLKTQLIDI